MADISIGNLYAELSFDTSGLEKGKAEAIQHYKKLKDEEERITKEAGENVTENLKIKIKELQENQTQALKIIEGFDADIKKKRADDLKAMGDSLMSHVTGPLKSFAEDAIATFANFEQSMQNVFSVMGASESDMQLLTETAKKMGETTRFSASQAAQALYSLGSAGQNATEATKSLQGVLRLAGATGSDLAYTSETIASTLSQFNLEAGKAGHIADVFSMAISKSQANMTKLSYSMKYVGPVASGLGVSLETTTAALMQLYNTGFGGEQAGTYLRNALQKLASGTEDLKNKLGALGIAYEDVNPQTNNFANILDTLKEHGVGVTEAISIFGEASGGAMAKLIEQGGAAVATMEGVLTNSEGAAESMQKIQNTSFANTQAELASAFEAVKISVGEILMPAINFIAQGFTSILQTINNLPIGIKTFAVAMGVVVAAIGVLFTVPALIGAIKAAMIALNGVMVANPIFLLGAVIATVAAAAYSLFKQTEVNIKELSSSAKQSMAELEEASKKATDSRAIANELDELLAKYEALGNKTNKTKEEQDAYNQTLSRLVELVPDVVMEVNETGDAFLSNLEKIKRARAEHLLAEQEQLKLTVEFKKKVAQQDALLSTQLDIQENVLGSSAVTGHDYIGQELEKGITKIEAAKKWVDKMPILYEKIQNLTSTTEAKEFREKEGFKIPVFGAIKDVFDLDKWKENLLNQIIEVTKNAEETLDTETNIGRTRIEIKERAVELEKLNSDLATVEKIINENKSKVPQLKKDVVDKILKEAEEKAKKAENKTSISGGSPEEIIKAGLKQKIEILKNALDNELPKMVEGIDITEAFSWELDKNEDAIDKDLKRIQQTLRDANKELNTKRSYSRGAGGSKAKEEEKKTLAEELEMLDRLYEERIKKAKEYGKDELAIQVEWQQKRLEFLDGLYEKEKEIELKNSKAKLDKKEITKAKYDEEIEAIEKKYQKEETLIQHRNKVLDEKSEDETNGVTIGDELAKTNAMMLELQSALAIANSAFNQKRKSFIIS